LKQVRSDTLSHKSNTAQAEVMNKVTRAPPGLPLPTAPVKQMNADKLVSAIKLGKTSQLPDLLDAAYTCASDAMHQDSALLEQMSCELIFTCLRACAASRHFKHAVEAYDHMASRIGEGNGALWSVLLYNVAEAGLFHRCGRVFQNLCKQSRPSGHDFVNMFRCYVGMQDLDGLRVVLTELHGAGHSIESYTLNRALASCGSGPVALDLADSLLLSGICVEGLDAVGYNTLMKCNARAGRFARCFELRAEMLEKGLELSEITYGILLDASIRAKELDCAREVFSELCNSGLRLNVVHCTTFMKGLIGAGRLDEAANVLDEMIQSPGVKPDLITYSTVVKAYAEAGNLPSALKLLTQMIEQGVKPDEIVFNGVLGACCTLPTRSSDIMETFGILVGHGMKPTTTTFSILLKSLALTSSHALAFRVLQDFPAKFHIVPELRLHTQLIRACLKARDGQTAIKVFKAMLKLSKERGEAVDPADVSRLIRNCVLEGATDLAVELQQAAVGAGIVLERYTETFLKTALMKRNRRG
jgi:pentatricopeptide repeat protein